MKKRMNNVGVSAVVATVLIVMITVAAVGLLWTIVSPFLTANFQDRTDCVEAEMSVSIDVGSQYTCNSENNGTAVKVIRGADNKDWIGVQIIYVDSFGNSDRVTYLEYPKPNSEKVYRNIDITDVVSISVTPALRKNDREFIYCSKNYEVPVTKNCSQEVEETIVGTNVNEDDLREQGADINGIISLIDEGVDVGIIADTIEGGISAGDVIGGMSSIYCLYEDLSRYCLKTENSSAETVEWTDLGLSDDDYVNLPLPFTFDFYGTEYSRVCISSNAYLVLTDSSSTSCYDYYFSGDKVLGIYGICYVPEWDPSSQSCDFDPSYMGEVRYNVSDERFVVYYDGVPPYGTETPQSFQITIYANGRVSIDYINLDYNVESMYGEEVNLDYAGFFSDEGDLNIAPMENNTVYIFTP